METRAPVFLSTKAPSALITVSLADSMATRELAKVPAVETASIKTSPAMIPYSRLWTRLLDSAWLFRGSAAFLLSSSPQSSWVKEAFAGLNYAVGTQGGSTRLKVQRRGPGLGGGNYQRSGARWTEGGACGVRCKWSAWGPLPLHLRDALRLVERHVVHLRGIGPSAGELGV